MRPEEIAKIIERHVRVSVAYDGPSIVNIDDASEEIAAAFAGTVDKAEAWDAVAEKNAALATARNDALEEAKQAVIRFGEHQNTIPGEISYERGVAAEDIADIIEALKSETKP